MGMEAAFESANHATFALRWSLGFDAVDNTRDWARGLHMNGN